MNTDQSQNENTHGRAASELSGLVMLPRALTAENGAKELLLGEFADFELIDCPECLEHGPDDDCEMCAGNHKVSLVVPVSWPTIKEIYAKIVEHYAQEAPVE